MKVKNLLICLFVAVLPLVGCSKEEEGNIKTLTVTVAPQYATFVPWFSDVPVKCLKVKFDGDKNWTTLTTGEIDGFVYQSGYEWVLSVEREKLDNPPADASCYKYSLLKIVSKTEKRPGYSNYMTDVSVRVDCVEEMKAVIEADLHARIIPVGTKISFEDSYAWIEEPETSYEGIIYLRNYSHGSVITLIYNNKTYEFTASDSYFMQDLTAEYAARYPEAGIKMVVWGMRYSKLR